MKEVIYLNEDKCIGCNKCIRNCPIMGANIAYNLDGKNKVKINTEKCIHCGKCISCCDHNARDYYDDTESFFKSLKEGKKISVIAAPSIRINFPNFKKLFGYLKSKGVNLIYDVSFGADITTWAYLNIIKNNSLSSVLAQPCPTIVNYIQKYQPELLHNLCPVHSPMLCTAIYMRKYMNITDEIAFLSPCISKIDEINDPNTKNYVKYNVTFKKLEIYLKNNNINISSYTTQEFEDRECSLGYLFSRPGGLKENVEAHLKGAWVRQVEGSDYIFDYLLEYSNRVKSNKTVPLLVDILNCEKGCNFGTGSLNNLSVDDADYEFNAMKENKLSERKGKLVKKIDWIYKNFDKMLNIEDFIRKYSSNDVTKDLKEPTEAQYDSIFKSMCKDSKESRSVNCSSCGYDNCRQMAKAIYNNLNSPINCIDYNQKEVLKEKEEIANKNKEINVLGELNKLTEERLKTAEKVKLYVNEIISAVFEASKGIEESSSNVLNIAREIQDISSASRTLRKNVEDIKNYLDNFSNASSHIVSIADQTSLISLNAAIEAARAGEEGKSFSVVAEAIKKLSFESKKVANSTKKEQESLLKLLDDLLEISDILEKKMSKTEEGINNTSAAIEQISAKSEEIVSSAKTLLDI